MSLEQKFSKILEKYPLKNEDDKISLYANMIILINRTIIELQTNTKSTSEIILSFEDIKNIKFAN